MMQLSLLALVLAVQAPVGPTPIELAWGDLDSDGLLDLLIVDEQHAARFYRNAGMLYLFEVSSDPSFHSSYVSLSFLASPTCFQLAPAPDQH
mgnify:CR=1 FL=1